MAALMGIDLGTSSLKVLIVDENGTVLSQAARSYQFESPKNGYAQQDPEEWWQACCESSQEAIAKLGIPAEEIKSVGFSGQMHGLVMLDAEKKSVRPAILHCDMRSVEQVGEIKEILGKELILEEILNPYCPGVQIVSLLWMREHEPENFAKIRYHMFPKDYLKFRITGEVSTDCSDAAGGLAYDVKNGVWSDRVLECLGMPKEAFPAIYETSDVVGTVTEEAAKAMGLKKGTLVTAGGGDQVMQAIGNGAILPGQATSNIGTAGQVSVQSDKALVNPALNTNTFTAYAKNRWYVMGAIYDAGASMKWLNSLFGKPDYEWLNAQVAKIRPGSNGLIYLPYLTGNRTPHVNPDLCGGFVGLTLNTKREHLTRAVMEGVVYSLRECMDVVCGLGIDVNEITASGGGARSAPWLQIQADLYGVPVRTTMTEEQAGLGAAITAGVGAGIYKSVQEGCAQTVRFAPTIYEPIRENQAAYAEYYELFKELFRNNSTTLETITRLGRKG